MGEWNVGVYMLVLCLKNQYVGWYMNGGYR